MLLLIRICVYPLLAAALTVPAFPACVTLESNYNPLTRGVTVVFRNPDILGQGSFEANIGGSDQGDVAIMVKIYPNGDETNEYTGGKENFVFQLQAMCGDEWVRQYITNASVTHLRSAVPHAAGTLPSSGQASQGLVVADLNGDGNLDSVSLTPSGAVVYLRASQWLRSLHPDLPGWILPGARRQ